LTLSPPLDIFNTGVNWFSPHVAYTIAKYGMTLCAYGHAEEFKPYKIAVNTLWPRTFIATSAIKNVVGGDEAMKRSRSPEIVSDAAYHILTSNSSKTTGNFFIDDEVLASVGVTDFTKYNMSKDTKIEDLAPDFFL
jgi:citronellol/citronellal dehydrogenase